MHDEWLESEHGVEFRVEAAAAVTAGSTARREQAEGGREITSDIGAPGITVA